jgi:septal ring factor EnvC (AmiA/AmiB activator)
MMISRGSKTFRNAVRRTLAAAVALACLALPCAAPPAAVAQDQGGDLDARLRAKDAELQKLREEIAQERQKIAEVEEKEKDIAGYLAKLDHEEKLVRRLLSGLTDKEGLLEQQVEGLRRDLAYSGSVYDLRRAILARRLREMYKDGPQYQWQELLEANDFGDLLQRYKFLSAIAERDANLVEEVRQRKTSIAQREANLTEKLAQATAARREKERELARLRANEQKRKKTLAELKTSKGKYQKRIDELARAERQLQSIIEGLEKTRTGGAPEAWEATAEKDFAALKGRMQSPVQGTRVRGFGESKHPEFGTVTFNPGVDIEAAPGSPVRAVGRGKVEYAGLLAGIGNCIIVAHGQGFYTLYVHASKIFVKQGAMVSSGDVIGEAGGGVGDASTPFHFEIRKSKKALDPAEWLKK